MAYRYHGPPEQRQYGNSNNWGFQQQNNCEKLPDSGRPQGEYFSTDSTFQNPIRFNHPSGPMNQPSGSQCWNYTPMFPPQGSFNNPNNSYWCNNQPNSTIEDSQINLMDNNKDINEPSPYIPTYSTQSSGLIEVGHGCPVKTNQQSFTDINSDLDQQWIEKWKCMIKITLKKDKKEQNSRKNDNPYSYLTLQEVSSDMFDWKFYLKKLNDQYLKLKNTPDEIQFLKLLEESSNIKTSMDILKQKFEDNNYQEMVKKLIKSRRQKRLRLKKSRSRNSKLKKWKEKEIEIDKFRDKIIQKERDERQGIIVKKEADKVLGDVNRKISETGNMSKILNVMMTLRDARLKKGDAHGYVASEDSTVYFENLIEQMKKMLDSKCKEYQLEKQTLIVMMEDTSSSTTSHKVKPSLTNQGFDQILFGPNLTVKINSNEEMSLEEMIQIRSSWDKYISINGYPLASSVPVGWVVPPENSNSEWQSYKV